MSPIEFFELPQGTPSVAPVSTGTGYCSASDVAALNRARAIGAGNNPTLSDLQTYIELTAGQIDAVLNTKGYQVPVNTASFPDAEGVLAWVNAAGAAWMMEDSSPNSVNVDRLKAAYDAALQMLTDSKFTLDVPMNLARSEPRGPWITFMPDGRTYDPVLDSIGGTSGDGISSGANANNPARPMFSRQMRF